MGKRPFEARDPISTMQLMVSTAAAFHEVIAKIASRWDNRPTASLHLTWREGANVFAVETEEQWAQCLKRHPRGVIELVLRPWQGAPVHRRRRPPPPASRQHAPRLG